MAPFALATQDKIDNQIAMVSLGRPGAGEQLLASHGFEDIERIEVPFVWGFADPDSYARALASTGHAYEAIGIVGETAFHDAAADLARDHVRHGLPLRAPIAVVGYLARKPNQQDLRSGHEPAVPPDGTAPSRPERGVTARGSR